MKARDNPFAVDRVQQIRYRFSEGDWSSFLQRLAELGYRAAVVGPHGAGKSTLLEDLGRRLTEQGRRVHSLRLNEQHPRLPASTWQLLCSKLDANDVILLDGAERMRYPAWRWFLHRTRRSGGLIITMHRPGRLPTLIHCQTTPQLLEELIQDLLADDLRPTWSPSHSLAVQALFDEHQGNLRDAIRALYDQFARDETPFAPT
jgi:hypothetical protein